MSNTGCQSKCSNQCNYQLGHTVVPFWRGVSTYRVCLFGWPTPGLVPRSQVGLVWLPVDGLGPGFGEPTVRSWPGQERMRALLVFLEPGLARRKSPFPSPPSSGARLSLLMRMAGGDGVRGGRAERSSTGARGRAAEDRRGGQRGAALADLRLRLGSLQDCGEIERNVLARPRPRGIRSDPWSWRLLPCWRRAARGTGGSW